MSTPERDLACYEQEQAREDYLEVSREQDIDREVDRLMALTVRDLIEEIDDGYDVYLEKVIESIAIRTVDRSKPC
jgi:hypothetical protein